MEDSQPGRRPEIRCKVNLAVASEVQFWSEKFDISKELLREIVQIVGTDPNAVEHELEVGGVRPRRA